MTVDDVIEPAVNRFAQANPVPGKATQGWGRTEDGEAVLAEILSSVPQDAAESRPSRRQVAVVLAGVLLVVLTCVGVSQLLRQCAPSSGVVATGVGAGTTPGSTTTAASDTEVGSGPAEDHNNVMRPPSRYELEHVRVGSALTALVLALSNADAPGSVGWKEASDPAAAVRLGVVTAAEASALDEEAFVTRGQYALWLWRAYGSHLESSDTVPRTGVTFHGLDTIPGEMRDAVLGLAAYGVVRGFQDGSFGAATDITRNQYRALLSALRERLPQRLLPREGVIWAIEVAREWVGERLRENAEDHGLHLDAYSMEDAFVVASGAEAGGERRPDYRVVTLSLTTEAGLEATEAFVRELGPLIHRLNYENYTLIGVYRVEVCDEAGRVLVLYQNDLENHEESWE